MIITYTDDKKEKYQSVRATANLTHTTPMGHGEIYTEGFGSSNEEAARNLIEILNHITDQARLEVANIEPTREISINQSEKISSIDAALSQLTRAMLVLVEDNDSISSITLAGAADEILSIPLGDNSAVNQIIRNIHKDRIAEAIDGNIHIVPKPLNAEIQKLEKSKKKLTKFINKPRNTLKHHTGPSTQMSPIEAEMIAVGFIFRALTNAFEYDPSYQDTNEVLAFCDWLKYHYPQYYKVLVRS